MKRFGVSTHLYRDERLQRAHLADIASHGFETVELFAARSHFDYHDPKAIHALAGWLRELRLDLPSVHATLIESAAALDIARHIPFRFLVVHAPIETGRAAATRSIEDLHHLAKPLGVKVALEVMGDRLSTVEALLELVEGDLDGLDLGICMDVGHAFMMGDTAEAIETASGYLVTTHIHDNRQQRDDHLVPFEGAIDWAATMMAFEKIGDDGPLMFEVGNAESPAAVLARSKDARQRLEGLIGDSSELPAFGSQ